jgi:ribose transport system permease protein
MSATQSQEPRVLLNQQPAPPAAGPRQRATTIDWRDYAIYIGFVVVFVLFAVLLHDNGFLRETNLLNIVRQTAIIAVMAVAGTFVIASAEIDLSVGSVAGLASVVTAMVIGSTGNALLGILAALGVGLAVGTVNGVLVTLLRMPSFLVTLAMLGIAIGIAQWISDFQPQPILNDSFNNSFGSGDVGPIPSLLIWAAGFAIAGAIILNKTSFGRHVLATGGNRIAAEFSGVSTARIKFTVLLASGVVASIAGMLYAGRLHSGRYQWGTGDELSVIAAVVLGGTSLFGGNGRVVGALFGALFIGLINNGLILAGLDTSQQRIIQGLIIIVAVALGSKKK